jgi:hypothetical protein
LPRRGSRAHWITCGLEQRDEPDTASLTVAGHMTPAAHPNVRGDKAVLVPSEARPRPEGRGLQAEGHAGQVPPKACNPKSNVPTRLHSALMLLPIFGRESGTGQTELC